MPKTHLIPTRLDYCNSMTLTLLLVTTIMHHSVYLCFQLSKPCHTPGLCNCIVFTFNSCGKTNNHHATVATQNSCHKYSTTCNFLVPPIIKPSLINMSFSHADVRLTYLMTEWKGNNRNKKSEDCAPLNIRSGPFGRTCERNSTSPSEDDA